MDDGSESCFVGGGEEGKKSLKKIVASAAEDGNEL
jgi:hypothetical protein